MNRSFVSSLALGLAVLTGASLAFGQGADPVATRGAAATPAVPKLVFALYYPWYGLKGISPADRHFGKLDPIHKTISNFAHYPAAGPYDSTDPKTVARHMADLKAIGVDVVACSWWGASDYTAGAIRALLPVAAGAGLKVCLFVEQFERVTVKGDYTSAAVELDDLLKTIGRDPAYLTVGGKPVVFVYDRARDQIGNDGWARAILAAEQVSSPGVVAIGDVEDGAQPDDARVFDGVHYNNPAARVAQLESVYLRSLMRRSMRQAYHRNTAAEAASAARSNGRIVVATVSPGFDDRKLGREGLSRVADREDGAFYRDSWDAALATSPDWVLIQSYNQWHDGTEIEPSLEFGDRYLRMTMEYVKQFKSGASPQGSTPASAPRLRPVPLTAAQKAVRDRVEGGTRGGGAGNGKASTTH